MERQDPPKVKIYLLGAENVGKSTLIDKYINGNFISDYDPTIEDTYLKLLTIDNCQILAEFLDPFTSGISAQQEEFLKSTHVILACFAINDRESLHAVQQSVERALAARDTDSRCSVFFVATKADLLATEQRAVYTQDIDILQDKYKTTCFFVSGKTGEGVDQLFSAAVTDAVGRLKLAPERRKDASQFLRKATGCCIQ